MEKLKAKIVNYTSSHTNDYAHYDVTIRLCSDDVTAEQIKQILTDNFIKVIIPEDKKYYAKIKGWEKMAGYGGLYFNYNTTDNALFLDDYENLSAIKTTMTLKEWNKLGINNINADFEEAE